MMDTKPVYLSDGELRRRLGLIDDDQAINQANADEVAALRRRVQELEIALEALADTLALVTLFGDEAMTV